MQAYSNDISTYGTIVGGHRATRPFEFSWYQPSRVAGVASNDLEATKE